MRTACLYLRFLSKLFQLVVPLLTGQKRVETVFNRKRIKTYDTNSHLHNIMKRKTNSTKQQKRSVKSLASKIAHALSLESRGRVLVD